MACYLPSTIRRLGLARQPHLRHKSGRPVVGRIAGPYRRCHLTERVAGRTRAGHVHAERIADCTTLEGAALCASGLAPCGASWAGTVVPDRQRRAAATPRGYRVERGQPVCPVSHQSHHLGGLAPHCYHRRVHSRSSQASESARHSGRLGPILPWQSSTSPSGRPSPTLLPLAGPLPSKSSVGAPFGPPWADHQSGRHGPARALSPTYSTTNRPMTHPATGPLTPARGGRHSQATRMPPGRHGPPGTGRPKPKI
jgi:hypothetical protein